MSDYAPPQFFPTTTETRESHQTAADLKKPVTELINRSLEPFITADKHTPFVEHPLIAINTVATDVPESYFNDRGDVFESVIPNKHVLQRMGGVRRERYPDLKPVEGRNYDTFTSDDPALLAYANWRSNNGSGLGQAFSKWDTMRGDKFALARWEFSKYIGGIDSAKDNATFFHEVMTTNMGPYELHSPAFKLLVLPTFAQETHGEDLMNATTQAIYRVTDLAKTPSVDEALATVDYDTAAVARSNDLEKDGDPEEAKKQTGTRLLVEAVMTTAQAASLLLADVKTPFDVANAIESLARNGGLKILGLLQSGIIGPMSGNGTRWDPRYTLNQEKLASGEFALSDNFRNDITAYHVTERTRAFGKYGLDKTLKRSEKDGVQAVGAGCPASAAHMYFAANLIVRELRRNQE